jgi:ankyrin repeat protein
MKCNFVNFSRLVCFFFIDFENSEGKTPLMYLVKENWFNSAERFKTISETAGKIIKSKVVDLNAQDDSGKTALMYFIEKNPTFDDAKDYYNNIILDIIQKANVNLKDTSGKTALFYAVIENNSTITTAILKNANVNAKDKDGKTALFYAKNSKMVGLLLRKISVDEKDNSGKTALFYAPPKLIAPLVKGGAKVNMQDNLGKTALGKTALFDEKNMAEKVKELLDNGADVTIVDNEGKTVIEAIIEKLGYDSSELLGVLMKILEIVPNLDLSYKNQKG